MSKFVRDLREGNTGEIVISYWLQSFSYSVFELNDDSKWDIKCGKGDKIITIEVKTDRYEKTFGRETGNLFIETGGASGLSGIWKTEADYYFYYLPDLEEVWIIKTTHLKSILPINQHNRTSRGGDSGRVTGILLNRDENRHHFIIRKIPKNRIGFLLFS